MRELVATEASGEQRYSLNAGAPGSSNVTVYRQSPRRCLPGLVEQKAIPAFLASLPSNYPQGSQANSSNYPNGR